MLWTEKMFGVKKPIITMLHLDPLPGDPRFHYGDTMERVVSTQEPICTRCRRAAWTESCSATSSACPMSAT